MKRCVECDRTYTDDNQKFCTHDGGRLVQADATGSSADISPTPTAPGSRPSTDSMPPYSPGNLNETIASFPTPGITREQQATPAAPPVSGGYSNAGDIDAFSQAPHESADFGKTIAAPPPPDAARDLRTKVSIPTPSSEADLSRTIASIPFSGTGRDLKTRVSAPPSEVSAPLSGGSSAEGSDFGKTIIASAEPLPTSKLQSVPVAPETPLPQSTPQVKKKRNVLLWVLASLFGLGVAGAILLVAVFYLVIKPRLEANRVSSATVTHSADVSNTTIDRTATNDTPPVNTNSEVLPGNSNIGNAANANTEAAIPLETEKPASAVPPNGSQFVSSSARLEGALGEHYSRFSFFYPKTWTLESGAGKAGATYFVEAVRKLPPNLTQEDLAVSWYESGGTMKTDEARFPELVSSYSSRLEKGLSDYKKVSEGNTSVNSIEGYEFRFEGRGVTGKGEVKYWGRMIFLPPGVEGAKNGIRLLVLGTSLAPELTSLDDVGVKGDAPMILDSFKLGS